MVQLLSIATWSPPLLALLGVRQYQTSNWSYHLRMLFPLAFAKFLSSVLAHVSVWKVPVSYAHTVKASMPLFTVLLTRVNSANWCCCPDCDVVFRQVCLGTQHGTAVYLSLIPIVLGVAVATLTEVNAVMISFLFLWNIDRYSDRFGIF